MDIKDVLGYKTIKCPDCGGTLFEEKIILKSVSKIVSPTGKDEILPLSVFVCSKCGKPNKEFLKMGMGLTDDNIDVLLGEKEPEQKKATSIIMDNTILH